MPDGVAQDFYALVCSSPVTGVEATTYHAIVPKFRYLGQNNQSNMVLVSRHLLILMTCASYIDSLILRRLETLAELYTFPCSTALDISFNFGGTNFAMSTRDFNLGRTAADSP